MRNVVMGVDPGTAHIGVAVVRFGVAKPTVLQVVTIDSPSGGAQAPRLDRIARQLWHAVEANRPEAVAVEMVAEVMEGKRRDGHGSSYAAGGMREVVGMVRQLAAVLGVPCYGVAANTAKLVMTGSGRADKETMVRAARVLFGVEDLSEHAADALAIAKAGFRRHNLASLKHATDTLSRRPHVGNGR